MSDITLFNRNGQILASSLEVAEKFGKKHAEVIYSIEGRIDRNGKVKNNGLLMSGISQLSQMFIKSEYKDSMNREKYEYLMDRDGFSLLVMGFTGKNALEWKLKYIEAFNKMEEKLKSGDYLSKEEKLKLQLFSKDPVEVASAHKKLVELEVSKATAPLIPKAEFHDAISVAENCINFGKFAATFQNNTKISFGRNKIMDWCREHEYLCSSYSLKNKPSQEMIDSGYMKYKESTNERDGKQYISYTPLLTGKGQIWLTRKLIEYFK